MIATPHTLEYAVGKPTLTPTPTCAPAEAVVLHESLRSLGTHPVDVQVDASTSVTLQVYIGKDPVDPLGLKLLMKKQAARAAAAEAL
jgi:hypothetical protein